MCECEKGIPVGTQQYHDVETVQAGPSIDVFFGWASAATRTKAAIGLFLLLLLLLLHISCCVFFFFFFLTSAVVCTANIATFIVYGIGHQEGEEGEEGEEEGEEGEEGEEEEEEDMMQTHLHRLINILGPFSSPPPSLSPLPPVSNKKQTQKRTHTHTYTASSPPLPLLFPLSLTTSSSQQSLTSTLPTKGSGQAVSPLFSTLSAHHSHNAAVLRSRSGVRLLSTRN